MRKAVIFLVYYIFGTITTVQPLQYFKIIVLLNSDDFQQKQVYLNQLFKEYMSETKTQHFELQLSIRNAKEKYTEIFDQICSSLKNTNTAAILALGGGQATRVGMIVGRYFGIPTLLYNSPKTKLMARAVGRPFVEMDGSKSLLADMLLQLLAKNKWYHVTIVHQTELSYDGFMDTINHVLRVDSNRGEKKRWKIQAKVAVSVDDTYSDLHNKMTGIKKGDARVIILHCSKLMAPKILQAAKEAELMRSGYAWFLSEDAMTMNKALLDKYPIGLLGLRTTTENFRLEDVFLDSLKLLIRSIRRYIREYASYYSVPTNYCVNMVLRFHSPHAKQLYRYILETQIAGRTGVITFDPYGDRDTINVTMANLVVVNKQKKWVTKGYLLSQAVRNRTSKSYAERIARNFTQYHLNAIIWPGNTFVSPIHIESLKWTVVTTTIKPFIMDESPIDNRCMAYVPCLRVNTTDPSTIAEIFRDFDQSPGKPHADRNYELRCCKGFSIELMEKLAAELNFKYQMYIVADGKSGAKRRGKWNGMVRDLVSGAADMAIAAFSITQIRSTAIDFSAPYFYSGISMMSIERERPVPLHAFLEPLDMKVWAGIMIMATLTAVCMALYEWNSPFGLNPWGRKRKSNYTLASAFNAVYAILFGHTVKTKTPKSWPCKLLQNFWAATSIYIFASYTANLAAFIAGKTDPIIYSGIEDRKLLNFRVGVKESTSGESYLKILNEELYEKVVKYHLVSSNREGFEKLRILPGDPKGLDVYLGDTPVLEYQKSEQDFECTMKMVGKSFGDDGYGIGFQKNSLLRVALSQKIIEFHETGYLERLRKNYFYLPLVCFRQKTMQPDQLTLKFDNHAGLYVLLGVAIVLCALILLPLEHIVFKWFVPYVRRKPATSRWKNLNMMFVSQRLYRIVTSKELLSANHAFKEMATIIKEKQFTAIFQKNQKKQIEEAMKSNMQRRKFRQIITQLKQQIILEQDMEEAMRAQKEEEEASNKHDDDNINRCDTIKQLVLTTGLPPTFPPLETSPNERPDRNYFGRQVHPLDENSVTESNLAQSSIPNGGLPYQFFLTPSEFLPWNRFGSERNLKALSTLSSRQDGPVFRTRSVSFGTGDGTKPRKMATDDLQALLAKVDFSGIDLECLDIDQLSRTDLLLICFEQNNRLRKMKEEKHKLGRRFGQAGKRSKSQDNYSVTDEIFL